MGIYDILDYLNNHPNKWYTTLEISKAMQITPGTISVTLKRLRKTNFINYRNRTEKGWHRAWEYKSKGETK